jgi:Holliday junction resolvase RusA-like endonuclease
MVKSAEARSYSHAVAAACVASGLRIGHPAFPTGRVAVTLDLYRPAKRGDLDNFGKVALDALQGFVYLDDAQVVDLHFRQHDDRARPRVEVVVEVMAERRDGCEAAGCVAFGVWSYALPDRQARFCGVHKAEQDKALAAGAVL